MLQQLSRNLRCLRQLPVSFGPCREGFLVLVAPSVRGSTRTGIRGFQAAAQCRTTASLREFASTRETEKGNVKKRGQHDRGHEGGSGQKQVQGRDAGSDPTNVRDYLKGLSTVDDLPPAAKASFSGRRRDGIPPGSHERGLESRAAPRRNGSAMSIIRPAHQDRGRQDQERPWACSAVSTDDRQCQPRNLPEGVCPCPLEG